MRDAQTQEAILQRKNEVVAAGLQWEVVESVPGKIRVHLGAGSASNGNSPMSWFRFRKKADFVEMELRLERNNPQQLSQLHITVIMRAVDKKTALNPSWREYCNQIFCELRGYLAGASI